MKKLSIIISIFITFIFSKPSLSGEITDTEWNILGQLVITYFSGTSGKVECTVYNDINKAIGGGSSYASGGVARVSVSVPKKYKGASLSVRCNP